MLVPASPSPLKIFEAFKIQLHLPYFMEIVLTMCWSIWAVPNDDIFRNIPASVQRCKMIFMIEFALVILRTKSAYHPTIDLWLEAYV